ncbi:MAG: hypothetical protein GY820_35850 [Gammaproteobacteria bacterium]|nr:hypothetical protein [Gammaproteobacteria bacterium]
MNNGWTMAWRGVLEGKLGRRGNLDSGCVETDGWDWCRDEKCVEHGKGGWREGVKGSVESKRG